MTPLPVIPNMRHVRSVDLRPSAVEQRSPEVPKLRESPISNKTRSVSLKERVVHGIFRIFGMEDAKPFKLGFQIRILFVLIKYCIFHLLLGT